MKNMIKKTLHFTISLTIAFCTMLCSSAAYADDTDIYIGSGNLNSDTKPNILFVLDTSLSMVYNTVASDPQNRTRLAVMQEALETVISSTNNVNIGMMTFHSDSGGPVRHSVKFVDEVTSTTTSTTSAVIEDKTIPVSASADDAVQELLSGSMLTTTEELYLNNKVLTSSGGTSTVTKNTTGTIQSNGHDRIQVDTASDKRVFDINLLTLSQVRVGGNNRRVQTGFRFTGHAIPAGATITKANIVMTGHDKLTGAAASNITVEDSVNPSNFGSSDGNLSNRTTSDELGGASVSVGWPNISIVNKNSLLTSPDISPLIQHIVDKPGWSDANPINVIVKGINGRRNIYSRNRNSNKAARLVVEYEENVASVVTTLVGHQSGLRFNGLDIPQGAEVLDAQLRFVAAETSSESVNVSIKAEKAHDADPFDSTMNNISSRPLTGSTASWSLSASSSWVKGQQYTTPSSINLKSVIKEVVDQPGWCGGNSLAFIMRGLNGQRQVYTWDKDPSLAPELYVRYKANNVAATNSSGQANTGCVSKTVSSQITTGSDDVIHNAGAEYGNYPLWLGVEDYYGTDYATITALRFQGLSILKDAQISDAYIEFTAADNHSDSANLTVRGHDSGNSPTFSGNNSDVPGRTLTSEFSSWSPSVWSTGGKYQTEDLSDIVEDIVARPDWASGNAMSFIISGTGHRLAHYYENNPGLSARLVIKAQYNALGNVSIVTNTVRDDLISLSRNLKAVGGTPLTDTMYEAALYMKGGAVDLGRTRGSGRLFNQYNPVLGANLSEGDFHSRVSVSDSYTPESASIHYPSGCTAANLDAQACRGQYINASPTYVSPIKSSCQQNHIVLLTDGDPSAFVTAGKISTMTGQSCATNDAGEDCVKKLAKYLNEEDQVGLPGDQHITTHTIGFNLSSTLLEDIATAGGGGYHTANNAADLVTAFEEIVLTVANDPTSFNAPAVSVNAFNRLFHRNELYFSLFEPDRAPSWAGNIKKYVFCDDSSQCKLGELLDSSGAAALDVTGDKMKDTAVSYWSSVVDGAEIRQGGVGHQEQNVQGYTNRVIYTYPFDAAPNKVDLSSSADYKFSSLNSELTKLRLGDPAMSNSAKSELVDWVRGRDVDDSDGDGDTNDTRYMHADPLHSSPAVVTYGGSSIDPVVKLIYGTNTGGIKFVNAVNGKEEWSFIPKSQISSQRDYKRGGGTKKIYGVDGAPRVWVNDKVQSGSPVKDGIIDPSQGEFVRAYMGMRRGGREIFALDITPAAVATSPTSVTSVAPMLRWTIDNNTPGFSKLGQTWSKPVRTRVKTKNGPRNVLIFAGGYDDRFDTGYGATGITMGNAIYVVNIDEPSPGDPDQEGDLLLSISNTGSGAMIEVPGMDYPIPAEIAAIDSNVDGFADRLYVGDIGGQIWRVDLGEELGKLPANYDGTVVDRLANLAGTAQKDERSFFATPEIARFKNDLEFSSVSTYDLILLQSGARNDPNEDNVENYMYAVRDVKTGPLLDANNNGIADTFSNIGHAALLDVTNTAGSNAIAALKLASGYKFKLNTGEKGITKGVAFQGNYLFSTYSPPVAVSSNECSASVGFNQSYAIDLRSGDAAFKLDANGDIEQGNNDPLDRSYTETGKVIAPPSIVRIKDKNPAGKGAASGLCNQKGCEILPGGARLYRTYWAEDMGSIDE